VANVLCRPEDFLLRLWVRTAAVQCTHAQPIIDKCFPIYFAYKDNRSALKRMSSMLVSDKRTIVSNAEKLVFVVPGAVGLDTQLPSVAILTDMGLEHGAVYTSYNSKQRCLQIHVPGTSQSSYPFLNKVPGVESQISHLTRDAAMPPSNPLEEHLLKAFEFGKSSLPTYTHWEKGKEAPAGNVRV